eukprot:CAMPEP_0181230310 /NCGR_PEP_ID=MMETSP1096-20121128/34401_1 /TAXON_ID=156174 ORGANISM="Chrysochromulina ericina, Strain CCMP281" /NCGR_SAMPLE_ID=MMETSP1096 /ASSEMBLY_ACC=CAM_ASM_000453 /LENGTH=169 /DNA_ID=CAMNT_0023324069 /DNA_START=45 /DNA_END=551 /DNA_ORIENTATION=-
MGIVGYTRAHPPRLRGHPLTAYASSIGLQTGGMAGRCCWLVLGVEPCAVRSSAPHRRRISPGSPPGNFRPCILPAAHSTSCVFYTTSVLPHVHLVELTWPPTHQGSSQGSLQGSSRAAGGKRRAKRPRPLHPPSAAHTVGDPSAVRVRPPPSSHPAACDACTRASSATA